MAHIASVLKPHGIGLGNGVVSQCATLDMCTASGDPFNSDPCCCLAYRDTPWADVLTDMGSYSPLSNPVKWHGPGHKPDGPCPKDPNNNSTIIQYCGWEGGIMNMLNSPVATVYSDRAPQVSPAIWIGDCYPNGTVTRQGWTQSKLSSFLQFIDQQRITRIAIWCMTNESDPIGFPCQVDACPWMLSEISEWKARPSSHVNLPKMTL